MQHMQYEIFMEMIDRKVDEASSDSRQAKEDTSTCS